MEADGKKPIPRNAPGISHDREALAQMGQQHFECRALGSRRSFRGCPLGESPHTAPNPIHRARPSHAGVSNYLESACIASDKGTTRSGGEET